MGVLVIASAVTQLPVPVVSIHREGQGTGKRARLHKQSVQLVPPEFAILSGVPGSYENRCRHVVFFQQGFRGEEIVGVTIIKGHDDSTARESSLLNNLRQVSHRHEAIVLAQELKMLFEMLWAYGELPGIRLGFSHPVIKQDQHSPREIARGSFHPTLELA